MKLKEIIKQNKDKNLFWSTLFIISLKSWNFVFFRIIPKKIFLKMKYQGIFGKDLCLKNPQTLNEKLQWKKIYDKKEIYTLCADKYNVRDFIKKKIGGKYLIPLILSTNNPSKIDFNKIKIPFIIKTSHGSGQNIIIKDKEDFNEKEIIRKCKKWLKINYYYAGKEWQYKNIKPRILIEKLLLDEKGQIPKDYKFHCFNGKVEFIQVDTDRFWDHKRSFFNTSWKLLPFTWCGKKGNKPVYKINKNINRPENLNKMIKIAEKLSKDFDYVRVDLYSVRNRIYFGELTFHHGAGFESFFPQKYDEIFGKKLKLKFSNK